MDAPINTAGFMMLPMFLALAALITGLEVRPQLSVFGFCAVTGDMQPVGPNMRGMVNAAHALGVQTLVLAEGDAELLGPVAQGTGLTVLGVAGVDELLTAQVFQQRPHT
jgi:ATP-dependent Lon protease